MCLGSLACSLQKASGHVSRDENAHPVIQGKSEDVLLSVVQELGVLPSLSELQESRKHLKLLICVEGPRDVEFLKHICILLRQDDPDIPDLECDQRLQLCNYTVAACYSG